MNAEVSCPVWVRSYARLRIPRADRLADARCACTAGHGRSLAIRQLLNDCRASHCSGGIRCRQTSFGITSAGSMGAPYSGSYAASRLNPDFCVRRTEDAFVKRGMWTIPLTKFVPGLNGAAVPLAGMIKTALDAFPSIRHRRPARLVGRLRNARLRVQQSTRTLAYLSQFGKCSTALVRTRPRAPEWRKIAIGCFQHRGLEVLSVDRPIRRLLFVPDSLGHNDLYRFECGPTSFDDLDVPSCRG